MDDSSAHVPMDSIEHTIYLIRSQEVMLDADLAELYGVQTKVLKNERAEQ